MQNRSIVDIRVNQLSDGRIRLKIRRGPHVIVSCERRSMGAVVRKIEQALKLLDE